MDLDTFLNGFHGQMNMLEKVSLQQDTNYEDLFRRITRTLAANTNPNDIRCFAEALRPITIQGLLHDISANRHPFPKGHMDGNHESWLRARTIAYPRQHISSRTVLNSVTYTPRFPVLPLT